MRFKSSVLAILAAAFCAASARAQYHKYDFWDQNYSVQALLGAVKFENLKFDVEDSQDPATVDISMLPQFGGAWGTLPRGDRFQYGLETSFLMGVRFDKINYLSAGGGGLYVSLSTSMWMFDLAGGPYANLFLDEGKRFRLYGGVGPLMTFANYRSEKDYSNNAPDESDTQSVFGIGFYARTGLEFRLHRYGMLGVGARGTWSNVDFSEVGGSSELTGVAAFITYTAGL